MSLKRENIIKDKLLDYEVPFEEKYWDDFKKKLDRDKGVLPPVNPWNKYKYWGIAGGIVIAAFLFLLNNKSNSNDSLVSENTTISQQQSSNVESKNNLENNSNSKTTSENINKSEVVSNEENVIDIQKVTSNNSSFEEDSNLQNQNLSDLVKDSDRKNKKSKKNTTIKSKDNLNSKQSIKRTEKAILNPFDNKTDNQDIVNNTIKNSAKTGPSGIYTTTPEYETNLNQFSPIDGNGALNNITHNTTNSTTVINLENNQLESQFINQEVALSAINKYHTNTPNQFKKVNNIENPNSGSEIKWEFAKTQRWEIGAFGGIGLNIPTKYGPIATEEGQTSKRPNITTGAYFLYSLNKNLSIEAGFQYKSIEDNFAARVTTTDNNNLVEITETTIVSRLNSFELPVGINYHVKDWLHFSTGLTFAYVNPSKVWSETVETNLNGVNIEDYYVLAKQPNYGLRKIDIRAYAGLTFHVSPFLGFRFAINQGLIDRTKNDYYGTNHYNLHTDYTFSTLIRFNSKVLK